VLPFGSESSDDPQVEYLYSVIVGGRKGDTGPKRFHVVYSDAMRLVRTDDLELALKALEKDLHLFVGEMARGRIFVHSGVVGWEGKAILLPGRSFSGKSTLTAAFVRAGATYYSDEFALLDEDGLVHPFARPLSLRCADPWEGDPVDVKELGGTAGSRPLPVGLVLFTSYREGASCELNPLTPGGAVLSMLQNTLSARRQPELVLPVLERIAANAPAFSCARGEAEDLVAQLLARGW